MEIKEAIEWLKEHFNPEYNCCKQDEVINMAISALEKQVAKKAHWEIYQAIGSFCLNGDFEVLSWQCSECGGISTLYSRYCPNCGAKMDGGVNDDKR